MEQELNIHSLSYFGDIEQIRCLQLSQSELNAIDKNGCTPLHLACFKNHSSVIKYLIDLGANVQCQDNNLTTPLHWSVYNGNKEMVQLLIDKGSAQMEDVNGIQPIHLAALIGHTQILQILLTQEITNFKDKSGATPLHLAAYCGHNDCIKIILDSDRIDINAEDNNKITSIYLAAMSNLPDTVTLLLNNGVNSDGFCSAVRWAVINGNLELLKVLISDKSPRTLWNPRGYDSCWLLFFATMYGHDEVILYLLEEGHVIFLEEGVCDVYIKFRNISGLDSIVFTNLQKLMSLSNSLYWVLSYCSKSAIEVFIDNGIYSESLMSLNGVTLSPLHVAASFGNCDAIKVLLKKGIDVNIKSSDKFTPLQWAAGHGHLNSVKLLLEHGANTSNALWWAAVEGHVDIAKLLLENGAQLDEDDQYKEYSCTPLTAAASCGQVEMVKYLVDKGANINSKDLLHWCAVHDLTDIIKSILTRGVHVNSLDSCHEQTALHWAATHGHLNTAKLLIDSGIDVNAEDKMKDLPIHHAVESNHSEMVKFLISKGSRINYKGYTGLPLCVASQLGLLEIVKILVDAGADLNATQFDSYGYDIETPLFRAMENRHFDIVKYLLAKGAERKYLIHAAARYGTLDELKETLKLGCNIHTKNHRGLTALSYAVKSSFENTKFLIENGADVNVVHNDGEIPINHPILFQNIDIVRLLIENGANLNIGRNEKTVLKEAAFYSSLEIVKLLIENGADPNVADKYGQTPLHCAQSKERLSIMEYLLSKHADVNARDSDGRTPLHWAAQDSSDFVESVKLLLDYGADVNAITADGSTAISIAAKRKQYEITKLLLLHGANLHLDKDILSANYCYNYDVRLIKLLHLGGLQLSKVNEPSNVSSNDVKNYLIKMKCEPLTLIQKSRFACKKAFGSQYYRIISITDYVLPRPLQWYVAYEILD